MRKIVIISASNKNNLKLAEKFREEVLEQGMKAELINLVDLDLPVYSSKTEKINISEVIDPYVELLMSCSGLVFVAPEYNGGIPPVLVNFISWISRSGREDWRSCFNGKVAAIGTHSGGGGNHVLMAMRLQLSYLGVNVVGRQILTHFKKELDPQSLRDVVVQLK